MCRGLEGVWDGAKQGKGWAEWDSYRGVEEGESGPGGRQDRWCTPNPDTDTSGLICLLGQRGLVVAMRQHRFELLHRGWLILGQGYKCPLTARKLPAVSNSLWETAMTVLATLCRDLSRIGLKVWQFQDIAIVQRLIVSLLLHMQE